jgi:hypothetical protein
VSPALSGRALRARHLERSAPLALVVPPLGLSTKAKIFVHLPRGARARALAPSSGGPVARGPRLALLFGTHARRRRTLLRARPLRTRAARHRRNAPRARPRALSSRPTPRDARPTVTATKDNFSGCTKSSPKDLRSLRPFASKTLTMSAGEEFAARAASKLRASPFAPRVSFRATCDRYRESTLPAQTKGREAPSNARQTRLGTPRGLAHPKPRNNDRTAAEQRPISKQPSRSRASRGSRDGFPCLAFTPEECEVCCAHRPCSRS